jgi:hypothetical protein
MLAEWHGTRDKKVIHGPHSWEKLKQLAELRMLLPNDLIRRTNEVEWKTAKQFPELFSSPHVLPRNDIDRIGQSRLEATFLQESSFDSSQFTTKQHGSHVFTAISVILFLCGIISLSSYIGMDTSVDSGTFIGRV